MRAIARRRRTAAAAAALVYVLAACAGGGPAPVALSPHVDGVRHGFWRIVQAEGYVEEGCYVAGRLHGEWVLRDRAGAVVAREHWCHGRLADPGEPNCEGDNATPACPPLGRRPEGHSSVAFDEVGRGPRTATRSGGGETTLYPVSAADAPPATPRGGITYCARYLS